jgi:hypothetical protein
MHDRLTSQSASRTTAAIVIFTLCCLISSAKLILNATTPAVDDVAQRSDQRFAALKAALPARGAVGYVGESGNTGTADYYLAQYALAPLVIENSADHTLIIGNFPTAKPVSFPSNLQLVTDFGNGVLLLRNLSSDKDKK